MSPHPPDPNDADRVDRQRLDADTEAADWNKERMRAARPRIIRLNPDGSREVEDAAAEPEDEQDAGADTPPTAP